MTLAETAAELRRLHTAPELLQVVNVWDVASARVVAALPGTRAIATASHSIAATFGYPDGEQIPVDLMLDMAGRIARAVEVPVSADLEAGYGDPGETIRRAIGEGIVGANLEDELKPLDESVAAVEAAVAAADAEGVPFALNARTDAFLRGTDRPLEVRIADADRARAAPTSRPERRACSCRATSARTWWPQLVDGIGERRVSLIGLPDVPAPGAARRSSASPASRTARTTQRVALGALQDLASELYAGGVLPRRHPPPHLTCDVPTNPPHDGCPARAAVARVAQWRPDRRAVRGRGRLASRPRPHGGERMKSGIPIEISGLSKRFGAVTAVDDLSFTVEPGRVTGFLGPNGAGKTTTLRVLLGLVRASAGTATFGGTPYRDLPEAPRDGGGGARRELPPRPHGAQPPEGLRDRGRPARLRACRSCSSRSASPSSPTAGWAATRSACASASSLAYTLLGDPGVLVLDEPINGLDPEGIKWIRGFLQRLAHEGRTVLVSSHLLSEVQQSVDDVVIISRGRLVQSGTLSSLELEAAPRTSSTPPIARGSPPRSTRPASSTPRGATASSSTSPIPAASATRPSSAGSSSAPAPPAIGLRSRSPSWTASESVRSTRSRRVDGGEE